ncbi:ATP-NAD kinase family protein [Microbacterium mangrovi]|uniref:ATP-NAD kinase family protein n=1 Tax=Microbacterium mangrovi TaxID=1348253 RepID=UPI00068DDA92|nr:NAD(+)/NADH kinase [Microbacterium mangrovi]
MLGLLVNPVAGVGGPAGLAGSDGADVQRAAASRGSTARAASRAAAALEALTAGTVVLTAAGTMGEDAVRAAGLEPRVVYTPGAKTTPADTSAAARALAEAGATLVLFAGGDGTARDVAAGLDAFRLAPLAQRPDAEQPPVAPRGRAERARDETEAPAALGVPAGVKMYSPVFAVSPRAAGGLAASWLSGTLPVQQREVLDIDEEALRRARVEPRLFGMLAVPFSPGRTQARKAPTPTSERDAVAAAARGAVALFRPGVRYLLGPGGTMAEAARALGLDGSPLGVDVLLDGALVRRAASEQELLDEIARGPAQAVVTVIGGQGFLLGRGNQQLSARVLRAIGDGPDGTGPLLVVAPEAKLIELHGAPLLVDTGDAAVDASLTGFVRVVTGPGASSFYPVHAPELEHQRLPEQEGGRHAS